MLALLEKPHVYHAHDASGVHVDLVPRPALMMLRVAVLDRRVGSLDVSGVMSGVYAYWVRPCLEFVSVCPLTLSLFLQR